MEEGRKHSDKSWNWHSISSNPNITMEIIEKHPNKPWKWNRYLGIQALLRVHRKTYKKNRFRILSENKFTFENIKIKNENLFAIRE